MADHTNPAPSIVVQDEQVDAGASMTYTLPLAGVVEADTFTLMLLTHWYSTNPTGTGLPFTSSTSDPGWTLASAGGGSSGGGGLVHIEAWRAQYDGSMTDVTFTVPVACDASIAVFDVIDSHHNGGAAAQLQTYGGPHFSGADHRYWGLATIAFHPPVRHRIFAGFGGANNGGDLGPATGPPGDGWGDFHGTEHNDAKLFVASKATILTDIDPANYGDGSGPGGYGPLGIGGWFFQTAGGGWEWDTFGLPENQDGSPSPPVDQGQLQTAGQLVSYHYHTFEVEIEEDVPYWGMLCTPSTGS